MGRVDVEFDREPLRLPVGVELVALDHDVGLRVRQPGGDDEAAEAALEVGAERRRLRLEGAERVGELAAARVPAGAGKERFEAAAVENFVFIGPPQEPIEVPPRFLAAPGRAPCAPARSPGSRRPW